MKKLFAGMITAMLLVATMGTAVFAANSPDSETALKQQAKDYNSKVTSVTAIGNGNAAVNVTAQALDTNTVAQASKKVSNDYKNATVLAMTDLSVPDNTDLTNGVKVTLSVKEVLAGDNVKVLHQKSTGDWETLPATVGNGTVTVTMTSFSPVVIIRLPSSSSSGNNSSGSNTSSNNTSSSNTSSSNTSSTNTPGSNTNNTGNATTDSKGKYTQGYQDGYAAGLASAKGSINNSTTVNVDNSSNNTVTTTGTGSSRNAAASSGRNVSATSPKTGASLPALPIVAAFVFAGIVYCGKKVRNN
jgi:hypothetical protein